MFPTNPNAPPGFREAFDGAREATVDALVSALIGADEVVCGPLNEVGMFGWQLEGQDSQFSGRMQGEAAYGCAYLRHMINQGFMVSFCVWRREARALVCLKAWESGEAEPEWPRSTDGALVVQHKHPGFRREA